ncbi:unnamed protein product [Bursaphelenchus xylophilus]|uniref:(pine wood nematode) hypothetical protein n=1 Tax=Bursaphelenchus xylophilus TaxID=6326 RepID=A0A811LTN8_BURXY|nr:unnamed protein product [Bursaphelenchus xylophilus]CAG9122630.1 unnamed protein product [Bursaphelenchus xylophilus]
MALMPFDQSGLQNESALGLIPMLFLIVFLASSTTARQDVPTDNDDDFNPPAHYRLERHLMKHYNDRILPRKTSTDTVEVLFQIALYQIVEVNEPQQYIILNSWIIESWEDDFLYWDPSRFENITNIVLPVSSLWIPDTTLYNSLTMSDSESRRLTNIKVSTRPERRTAQIEFLYPALYKFSCTLDLKLFPFDAQTCIMTFGSWTHDNQGIDYYPNNSTDGAIAVDNCIENEGWNIIQTSVHRIVKKYKCCANNYTLLEFEMVIQRKPLYYITNLMIPTAIITFIAIIGFFSSATVNQIREEKITLGITTLLSMSILIFMVSDQMPSTSSFVPLIGWFYTSMMFLISLGTWASAVVISIQKKGTLGKRPDPDTMKWAKKIGTLLLIEVPLMMRQAYAIKETQDKYKFRGNIWMRSWQKISNSIGSTATTSAASTALIPPLTESASAMSGLNRVAVYKKLSSQDQMGVDAMILQEDPEDDFNSPYGSTNNPEFNKINESHQFLPSGIKPKRKSRIEKMASKEEENFLSQPNHRTLAEIEYDWMAEVMERVFLIVFMILFFICAVGIPVFGLYHWLVTRHFDNVNE